ncbi:MAG: hypothetical protein HKO53_04850, partial [Gemmatimonadetes bacterium]|nr:hypothetical protein [Gemmatimonadota bacterium]
NADLFARIESWAGPEIARQIRGIVDEGDPVELPRDLYHPWLTSFMGESGAFDLGFALGASQEAHEVRGVVRGSAAWKAGLRDGLPLRGWSVRFGDADSPVSFQVEEDGELKTIEYLPRGNPVPVVQFAAAPGVEVLFGGAGLRGPAPKE